MSLTATPPAPTFTAGRFVWRELMTRDAAAAKRFYGELFGWNTVDCPMDDGAWVYTLFMQDGRQVGGLMDVSKMADIPTGWAVIVSTPDLDEACARAIAAGGRQAGPMVEDEAFGRCATILDPQGGLLRFFRSHTGDREPVGVAGEFVWESLATPDRAGSVAFYSAVLGWNVVPNEQGDPGFFLAGEAPVSCIQSTDGRASWSTFVAVADLAATVAKVAALGGKVIAERLDAPKGAFAIVEDPTGEALRVYQAG